MSFLKKVIKAAAVEAVNHLGMLRIEQCCQQLGWDISHRVGANIICLSFPDPSLGGRMLSIVTGPIGTIARFSASCSTSIQLHDLPPDLGYVLLMRNKELSYASWQLADNGGKVGFQLCYTALVAGLDPGTFRAICEEMSEEAMGVDSYLRRKGIS